MRSSEMARLAGVSVRTLRHYHQVGVLAEPERSSNGYRHYDVHDLILLLRIRRLAALGIPLERMAAIIDDPGEDADVLLDDLDRELADQMDRLGSQREVIARLRAERTAPDLPPELARFLSVFTAAGLSPELARFDRDQTVLLAHLVGEQGMPHLAHFYEQLSDPELAPTVASLSGRFAELSPDAGDQEIHAIADTLVMTFGPALRDFDAAAVSTPLAQSVNLFNAYTTDLLNDAQLRVLERIESRLADSEAR